MGGGSSLRTARARADTITCRPTGRRRSNSSPSSTIPNLPSSSTRLRAKTRDRQSRTCKTSSTVDHPVVPVPAGVTFEFKHKVDEYRKLANKTLAQFEEHANDDLHKVTAKK